MKNVILFLSVCVWIVSPVTGQLPSDRVITAQNAHLLGPVRMLGFGVIHDVVWSPDGTLLGVASDAGVHLIPYEENDLNRLTAQFLDHHLIPVQSIAFSSDGTFLATATSDGAVRLWSLTESTPQIVSTLATDHSIVYDVSFSPDGTLLSAADANGVYIWDVQTTDLRLTLPGHSTVAFSPDGHHIAAASEGEALGQYDQAVRVWDVATGEQVGFFRGEKGIVRSVTYSPDGSQLAAYGDSGQLWLWTVEDPEIGAALETTSMRDTAANVGVSVMFNATGTLLAGGITSYPKTFSSKVDVWSMVTQRVVSSIDLPNSTPFISFHPILDVLAVGSEFELSLWDIASSREILSINNLSELWAVTFSPDSQIVAGSDRGDNLRLWDVSTGLEIGSWAASAGKLQFSPDGTRIVLKGFDHDLHLWAWSRTEHHVIAQEIATFTDQTVWDSITFTRTGELVIFDGTAVLWIDSQNGTVIRRLDLGDMPVASIDETGLGLTAVLSPPVQWSQIQLRFLDTDTPAVDIGWYRGPLYSVAVSPNDRWLSMSGWEDVYVWNVQDLREPRLFPSMTEDAEITSLSYTPNSEVLASASTYEVTLWDVQEGTILKTFSPETIDGGLLWGATFSPDGYWFMTGGQSLWLWGIISNDAGSQ